MLKHYIFIISILFIPILTFPQTIVPKIEWYKIYDGPGHGVDLPNDIKMDKLNNIYVGGRSAGLDGSQDLLLLKYSDLGDSLLELRYVSASQSWDEAISLAIDSGLNIYIVGSATFEQNTFYAIFHKYTANGELLWAKNFNDNININSEGVQVVLNSKEEAIIGYNQSSAKIAKYSSSGDSLWTVTVQDDTSEYQVNYLATDKGDNIYAAILQAYWDGGDLPATKIVVVKINDLGEVIWKRKIDGSVNARKIIFDKEDNPILLAADAKIIKFNSQGDTLWMKEYSNVGDIVITTDLGVDSDNDIVFTGYGIGDDSWDFFTQKLSSNGQDLWMSKFNSDEHLKDFAHSIAIDKENNIYVTGGSHNSISTGLCYTLKYSSEGKLKWKIKLDTPRGKFERGSKIFVDDSNNVFIGGSVADSINGYNFLAFKIRQKIRTGIKNSNSNIPIYFSLSQNYPNPFNPSTTISYSLPKAVFVELKIYDIVGRKILTLVNKFQQPGTHSVKFDASEIPSGIYFYKLQAGNFTQTRKMSLSR